MKLSVPVWRNLHRATPLRVLALAALMMLATTGLAATWFSLQEGDLRSGTDPATVNTSGTLLDAAYVTHCTYLRGYVDKANNFNTATELFLGTTANGTASDLDNLRLLAGFDLSPIVAYAAGNAYAIDSVNLIFTHRTAGTGTGSGMSLHNTTPFDETTTTWNNPGSGAPAGGTVGTSITTKSISGSIQLYPSSQLWTAAGLVTAIQNALANPTNKGAYFLLKRTAEGDGNYNSRYVTDENTNSVYGGVDSRPELQVAVTILSNASIVSVSAPDPQASEPGVNTGMFTITRTANLTNDLTVYYTLSGSASFGGDYVLNPYLSGSVVLPAGVSSTNILVEPQDDSAVEENETVVMTIILDPGNSGAYGLGVVGATVTIADDNDGQALVDYLFGGTSAARVWDTNVTAMNYTTPGLTVGFSGTAGLYLSSPSSLWVQSSSTTNSEAAAVTDNDYLGFSVTPAIGRTMVLTNLEVSCIYYNSSDLNAANAVLLVRSSLDNFATTLGAVTNLVSNLGGGWMTLNLPLEAAFSNLLGQVEFRLYIYDDATMSTTGLRVDNLLLRGGTDPLPPGTYQVNIAATQPAAAEPSTPGQFTLTRYGSTTDPLTVYYGVGGTASNGVDYALLSGQVDFGVGQSNTVITVTPIDDLLSEGTETVLATLLANSNYSVVTPTSATVTISDDVEPDNASLVAGDNNAYERVSALTGWFTLAHSGDTNSSTTVNFSLGGTAILGADYVSSATNSVVIPAGQSSQRVTITPLDDAAVEGTETVELTLQAGAGYILLGATNATVSIIDDDLPAETVLWSDTFDAGTSAANFTITTAARTGPDDYLADFAFDYAAAEIPLAPTSTNGIGLKLTANKDGVINAAAAVNCYPIGQSFSNDFALRFNLYLNYDPAGVNGEQVLFGLNQSGSSTNWRNQSAGGFVRGEAVWAALTINDQDLPSAAIWASTNTGSAPVLAAFCNQAALRALFNSPPFGVAGSMGNPYTSVTKTWLDVELSQVANLIALKLDGVTVLQYTNASPYTSGDLMLGYNDQFDSLGSPQGYAVFDNVRVVGLASATPPNITHIAVVGSTVAIGFSGAGSDTTASFKLQSSATVNGSYADDNSAVITGSAGFFQASTSVNGDVRFYRIRRN